VDVDGNLLLQEDPGNQPHAAKIWKFYPGSRQLVPIAKADPQRFGDREGGTTMPPTAPFNADEESSGILDVTHLFTKGRGAHRFHERDRDDHEDEIDDRVKWAKPGTRFYLGTVQAHYPAGDSELVEGGQLFLLQVPKRVR
jgi:hypothetical protein